MYINIFDAVSTLLGWVWNLLSGIIDLGFRFVGAMFSFSAKGYEALFNFFAKAFRAFMDLLFIPFTQGLDFLWDWSCLDLRALFSLVMWVLLGACVLLALFAVGCSLYRKYGHRISR